MELSTVPLTGTGLTVSELAFGTWRFGRTTDTGEYEVDKETATTLLDTYADHGGNLIDTANVYGDGQSEQWIGSGSQTGIEADT